MLTGVLLLVMMAGRGSAKGSTIGILLFLFCLALAVGIWLVVGGLNKRKFWAWVAGLGIFAIYLPSLFLPLGALGLWGLLDPGSRAQFGLGPRPRDEDDPDDEYDPDRPRRRVRTDDQGITDRPRPDDFPRREP